MNSDHNLESNEHLANELATDEKDFLIDPEPYSIFLGIVGFLGSVASIAGYIEFRKQRNIERRDSLRKTIHEAKDLLMSLEVDTMQLEVSLRKLEFILEQGGSKFQSSSTSDLKLQFGTCKPIFTLSGFNKFDEVSTELNRLVGKSFITTSDLLQKLYNIDIKLENEIYGDLINLQKRLNALLREDLTYQEGFRKYYEIIVFTKDILRIIRIEISRNL